jgi:hypothetical protein
MHHLVLAAAGVALEDVPLSVLHVEKHCIVEQSYSLPL